MKSFNLIFGILALISFGAMAYNDIARDYQSAVGYFVAFIFSFFGFLISSFYKIEQR